MYPASQLRMMAVVPLLVAMAGDRLFAPPPVPDPSAEYSLVSHVHDPGAAIRLPGKPLQDWREGVFHNIASMEYHISHRPEAGACSSPNRAQNFRIDYLSDGFILRPRCSGGSSWTVDLRVDGIGRGGALMTPATRLDEDGVCVDEDRMSVQHDGFRIDYTNGPGGMRQDFIVERKPEGDGPLRVHLRAGGSLQPVRIDDRSVLFAECGEEHAGRTWYGGLKAWDARGRELAAHMEVDGVRIALAVDDAGARYPVTVDPLSTTADWSADGDQAGAAFECSVAGAGDVNGDGYSDVIVGAANYDNGEAGEGRVFLYYGSLSGLAPVPDWSYGGAEAGAAFGSRVASAGDVNGDGFGDVIVGEPLYTGAEQGEGRASLFLGSAVGLAGVPAWMVNGGGEDARFGADMACAGDVNGDGYSDVIVAAPAYGKDDGRASLYYGSAAGLSLTAGWTTDGTAGSRFGRSVAGAGDVNGDGYGDVIIGADSLGDGQSGGGGAYVYHGSAAGLSTVAAWSVQGDVAGAGLGSAVAGVGDVDGDGYADVMVAAEKFGDGRGMARLYRGSISGLDAVAAWSFEGDAAAEYLGAGVASAGDVNADGYADVIIGASVHAGTGSTLFFLGSAAGLDANPSRRIDGDQAGSMFGACVAGAGDIDGDGCSDVLVGAPAYDGTQIGGGRAVLYRGAADGLPDVAAWNAGGLQAGCYFGHSVAGAGDVNGDVIVGAYLYDNGGANEGRAFLFLGSDSGLASTPAWTAEGDQADAGFGFAVANAGDVNNDGYDDVIISANQYDDGEVNEGGVFLFRGGPAGPEAIPSWHAEGNQAQARFGHSIAGAGDVNGDGYSDVVIGAIFYDHGEIDEGSAFLYLGSRNGLAADPVWSAESNQASARLGICVGAAGDVNGDGYGDVVVGAYQYDNGGEDEGRGYLFLGTDNGLEVTPGWTAEGDRTGVLFAYSIAGAGDVDGDGYCDVIVGAPGWVGSYAEEGLAVLYRGGPDGLSGNPVWAVPGNAPLAGRWMCAVSAGDVNGDGYSDVVVGSPYYTNGEPGEGRAVVYQGSAAGLEAMPAWSAEGNQANCELGLSVAGAGDVNGDGYCDVIVGAYRYDGGLLDEGRAFVFGGSGARVTPGQFREDFSGRVVPALASHSAGVGMALWGRTFFGRSEVKAQFEIKPLGVPFDGTGLLETEWTEVMGAVNDGFLLKRMMDGLVYRTSYRWRARLHYRAADGAVQPCGRWISLPQNGRTEADLRISGAGSLRASNWFMFSVPFIAADMSAGNILGDDFPSTPPVFAFGGTGYTPAALLATGHGYWLNCGAGTLIDAMGEEADSAAKLLTGDWNLIGNPFPVPLPKSSLRFTNGTDMKTVDEAVAAGWLADGIIHTFNGVAYAAEPDALQPWSAYWLKATATGITVIYRR